MLIVELRAEHSEVPKGIEVGKLIPIIGNEARYLGELFFGCLLVIILQVEWDVILEFLKN